MFGLGAPELLIILVILLLLFGGSKLPQLSRSIGQSMKELRRGIEGDIHEQADSLTRAKSKPTETKANDSPPTL